MTPAVKTTVFIILFGCLILAAATLFFYFKNSQDITSLSLRAARLNATDIANHASVYFQEKADTARLITVNARLTEALLKDNARFMALPEAQRTARIQQLNTQLGVSIRCL